MALNLRDAYSQTYGEARHKFLQACEAAGLDVEHQIHPLLGRDGETLAMDVCRQGPRTAERVLLLSSGCHGIEGYAGSGIQVALLRDADWHQAVRDSGVAVLYLHALNPYGFSWWRRVTQENVDLNRNFHDFSQPLPANPAYEALHALLLPRSWPPPPEVEQAIEAYLAEHGMAAFQAAVSQGQHTHEDGLYYGGRNPTWSNLTLRRVLQEHLRHAVQLAWIDLHTGLGPRGHGERIFASGYVPADLARARDWWGAAVTCVEEGSSSSARLTGTLWPVVFEAKPEIRYTGIALEFGTRSVREVFDALRAEQWLENHPEAPPEQARAIKQQLREAFYVEADDWKAQLVAQAREAALQALDGLGRSA
ncbi:M14 family metallopeptidase [Aquabacterium sp. A7-Y]|uniref:M14 family metallopeptidase n=1 Tax=Aquabacterium sp. A7-Y TaxID=1349605 RepID=UPI00223DFECE|nr:M14 family metallopeptidase [Aquabacterium sp. A7-Y]MCW7539038.1 M14 family metallopeptidase [Aquabacterium sp. A7-Y]